MKNSSASIFKEINYILEIEPNVDRLAEKIHELVSIAPISLGSIYDPGIILYRTTNHHTSIPLRIDDLWFPPKESARLSRANRDRSPIFYCSSDPICSYLEIGIQPGQLAIHSKWITTKKMLLHDIGYSQNVFNRNGSKREVPKMNQDFESSNFTEIHNYIHLAFTEPGSNKYSLTSAIAEVHLRSDEISGIRYPAITKNSDVDNIALKPEFVLTSVILESAQLIKVEDISKDTNVISGEIIADLVGRSDGNLKWHFRGQDIPVYPGEAFPLGVGIHIIRSPADVRIENKFYHLEAGYAIEIPPVGDVIVRNIKGEIIKPRSIN